MRTREYLDHNLIVALFKKERPGLREHIDSRKATGAIFPYSSAHIESAISRAAVSSRQIARAAA